MSEVAIYLLHGPSARGYLARRLRYWTAKRNRWQRRIALAMRGLRRPKRPPDHAENALIDAEHRMLMVRGGGVIPPRIVDSSTAKR